MNDPFRSRLPCVSPNHGFPTSQCDRKRPFLSFFWNAPCTPQIRPQSKVITADHKATKTITATITVFCRELLAASSNNVQGAWERESLNISACLEILLGAKHVPFQQIGQCPIFIILVPEFRVWEAIIGVLGLKNAPLAFYLFCFAQYTIFQTLPYHALLIFAMWMFLFVSFALAAVVCLN